VYAVAFFKVVQQQTIGEVGYGYIILSAPVKELKSDSICQSYAQMNTGPVF